MGGSKESEEYVERVRSLVNGCMERIGGAVRERDDCLARWKLPDCLGVCMSQQHFPLFRHEQWLILLLLGHKS